MTEDGPPAKDVCTFKTETLHRENRWICQYGVMAVAEIKKVHLIVWQHMEEKEEPWTKIAVFSPRDEWKQFPVIHIAKVGSHYMPLIPDEIQVPGNELHLNGRVWRSKGFQNMKEEKVDIRGGGSRNQHDPFDMTGIQSQKETIDDLLKSPTPWTTPEKKWDTPESVKTQMSFNIHEILRTPKTPATPLSNARKNVENKNNCDIDLPKVCQWACPFCQFQCHIADPGKRTQDIRTHLDKFDAVETKKSKEKNIREGVSASGRRHGLGIAVLLQPIPFQKIPKQDTKIICPFCKLGAAINPSNAALRKKTWKHHLKSCTKAPKGCTLKALYALRMKKEGGICLGDGKIHREKMIQGIWKKADAKAKDHGHAPSRLIGSKGKAYDVICKKCWRVASHARTWNSVCEGEEMQSRSRLLPSVNLWKKFLKEFGKEKLFHDHELNTQQQERIQTAIHESDKRRTSLKRRPKRQSYKNVSKVEHKKLRLEGLRNKAIKDAKACGHDPVRLNFQRSWQSGGTTNLICRKCWRVSQHTTQWRSKCIGHHNPTRSILTSRAWWKTCVEEIGSAKLYKIMLLNKNEKELIEGNVQEYIQRKKEYSKNY